jgi:hypothetical protein
VDERFALRAIINDAPGAIAICLLAHGLFKNFASWRPNATSDLPGKIVQILLRQLSVAGRGEDARSLTECARVMDMLLACDVDIVKDTCAVALAQSMLGFGYAISKPVQSIIHEALCIYRNGLDGPRPIMVRRYFAKCRFPERLAAATSALAAVGLTAHASDHEPFTLKGPYSVREHGLVLLDLACVWATNPRRVGSHASAILMYVWWSLSGLTPQDPDDEKLISELNEAFELAKIETSLSNPGNASVDPPPPDRPPA